MPGVTTSGAARSRHGAWRGAAVAAGGVLALAAPFLLHAVLAGEVRPAVARVVVTAQVGIAAFAAARRWRGPGMPRPALAGGLAMAGVLLASALAARASLAAAAALAHATLYGGLAAAFGLSLRPGHEALATRLARQVEPVFTPALLRYTRGVSWLWLGFALAQLAASAALLLLAPLRVWSAFVNLVDLPLVLLTFALEYAVRRWHFRGQRLATLRETVRAVARGIADPAAAPSHGGQAGGARSAGHGARGA